MTHCQDDLYFAYRRILVGFVLLYEVANTLFDCQLCRVLCMKQTTLIQSGAPGWTNFSHQWSSLKFSVLHWICLLFISFVLADVELPLCPVDTLILECYNLFAGVKLSIRSFWVFFSKRLDEHIVGMRYLSYT